VEIAIAGLRVLIAEDEYLIADNLKRELLKTGVSIIGPFARLDAVYRAIRSEAVIDAALLDVNLDGEMVFPAAKLLAARGVPFLLVTGYDAWAIPEGYAHLRRLEKPIGPGQTVKALEALLAPFSRTSLDRPCRPGQSGVLGGSLGCGDRPPSV
jgi:DNA-binding response OmpR family regulator